LPADLEAALSALSRQEPTPAATTGRTPTPATSSPSSVRRLTPVEVWTKAKRPSSATDDERWEAQPVSPTLNSFDAGDARAVTLVAPTVNSNRTGGWRFDADQAESLVMAGDPADDPLLPLGLDSHRYRAIGNGVAAPVAEWIGLRLAAYFRG
ncbi:MAG: hypothetical protein WCP53_16290, partial [Verrucomicrobiota bacterium]